MTSRTRVGLSIRRQIFDQLETSHAKQKGLSPTNWALLFLILFSIALYTAETEYEIQTSESGVLRFLNGVILLIFGGELNDFARRLCYIVLVAGILLGATQIVGLFGASGSSIGGPLEAHRVTFAVASHD